MKYLLKEIAWVLVIIGAINWGLIGLFGFNLVDSLFGSGLVSSIIYCLVGFSAVILIVYKALKHSKKK
jgi:hypothetical protein